MALKNLDKAMSVLRAFANETVPSKVKATAVQIATYGLNYATTLSPIESGRFAASWRVSVNAPSQDYAPKGSTFSATDAQSEAVSASAGALSQIQVGTKFYISNAIPYAIYVEYGSPTSEARYISRRVAQAIGGKFGKI